MRPWVYHLAATLVMLGHVVFMACVVVSWSWPLPWQLALFAVFGAFTVLGRVRYRGRCPVTLLEYRLRRLGGYRGPAVGMTRRLMLRLVSEDAASRWAYGIALASLLAGLLRAAGG